MEHQWTVKTALQNPSHEVREGFLAVQLQFLECGQASKIEDSAKLASTDEKDLGQRVTEVRENLEKVIHCEIIDLFRYVSILPQHVAKMAS